MKLSLNVQYGSSEEIWPLRPFFTVSMIPKHSWVTDFGENNHYHMVINAVDINAVLTCN